MSTKILTVRRSGEGDAERGAVSTAQLLEMLGISPGGGGGTDVNASNVQAAIVADRPGAKTALALVKSDVGLANADNTADTAKPVSTAQATAIGLKEDSIAAGIAAQYWRGDKSWQTLNKAAVALGAVDNTSDADKPVSTAQQTALDLKAPLASPPLTGAPTAPTAAPGTNTTQLSTTAFVQAAIAALIAAAPGALDTLDELAAAMGDDANFATTVTNALALKQPIDADLTAIAALATTAFGRGFLDLVDAAAARTKLGLGTAALNASGDFQPSDADLTAIAALTTTAFGRGFLDLADAAAGRTKLGLGTAALNASGDFQPSDADLTAIAALVTTAFGRGFLDLADAAAAKTKLALVKADVGLGNVDNTSDANKPVSTAQQTALDLKAPIANPVHTGMIFGQQSAPISKSAAATLTIAELLTGLVQYTGAAAALTVPTGTLTDAGILGGALAVDRAFEWVVVNTGSGAATVTAGTGHTLIGAAAVAAATSGRFRTRKTAANTFVTYRL